MYAILRTGYGRIAITRQSDLFVYRKDKTIVKYSLLNDSSQIFASKYMLYLPTEQELKKEIERQRVQIEQEQKLNQ